MPAYRFEALDAAGKSQSGLVEADNAKAARAQLRGRELVPLAVTPVTMAAPDTANARFTRRVFFPNDNIARFRSTVVMDSVKRGLRLPLVPAAA